MISFDSSAATWAVTADQVVIVMKSNCARSLLVNSNNRDPVKSEISSAPGIKPAGISAALSIVREFDWNTNAVAAASATGDGGVALEFDGTNNRQVDVIVPDEGTPCYFVASCGEERSTGVIDNLSEILPLCKWLQQGGSTPGKLLPQRA